MTSPPRSHDGAPPRHQVGARASADEPPPVPTGLDGLVSVITPVHNAARFVSQAIESVRAQTWPDWELILCDDASSDGSAELCRRHAAADPRIRLVARETRGGTAAARNSALAEASGRYVAFLDADDWWAPAKLERQVAFMRARGAALAFTGFQRVAADGTPLRAPDPVPASVPHRRLLGDTVIGTSTVMVDRHLTGAFTMPPGGRDDFACWLRLLRRNGPAAGLDQVLTHYRAVSGSVSSRRLRGAVAVWRVYRRSERLPVWTAAYHFGRYLANAIRKHYL